MNTEDKIKEAEDSQILNNFLAIAFIISVTTFLITTTIHH